MVSYTFPLPAGEFVALMRADAQAARVQNSGGFDIYLLAGVGDEAPRSLAGAQRLPAGALRDVEIATLFPGIAGADTLWAWGLMGGAASVSHAGVLLPQPVREARLAPGAGEGEVMLDLVAPYDGGSPLTALEYSLDQGISWTALPDVAGGSYTLALGTGSHLLQLRAVNALGAGPVSRPLRALGGRPAGRKRFKRLVFVGASIMNRTFGGASLAEDSSGGNWADMEAKLAANGAPGVEVRCRAVGGYTVAQIQPLLQEALDAYPGDDTLFCLHAGGNNATNAQDQADFEAEVDAMLAVIATRPGQVLWSDISWRTPYVTTKADAVSTAANYNSWLKAKLLAAKSTLFADGYYDDMTAVTCFNDWVYANRAHFFETDDIVHPDADGQERLRGWFAERLAPLVRGSRKAVRFGWADFAPEITAPAINAFVLISPQIVHGCHRLSFTETGVYFDGPADKVLNYDGSYGGLTAKGTYTGAAVLYNSTGRADGNAEWQGTLDYIEFTRRSCSWNTAQAVKIELYAAPNTVLDIDFTASRKSTSVTNALWTGSDGTSVEHSGTADPTSIVSAQFTTDGNGRLELVQTLLSGYAYDGVLWVRNAA
ncbi:SGNH/GDSL hydrolase family protein [Thioclava sp. GXIMD4215]|uniref:SGNH/GDSL hydrolase family protein n=1 Tax=Thioclava sp. GXIMD4215 TaxID=3131928 RepID=UPI00324746C8